MAIFDRPIPQGLRVPGASRVVPSMRAAVVLLLLAASPARAGVIPPELEKLEDDVGAIEQGRRLLTRFVDQGDVGSAREVLAFLRLRVDWKRYRVFNDTEEVLLGAFVGDYDFLHPMADGRPDVPDPPCCGPWRDVLMQALLNQIPAATRTTAEARTLSAADRAMVELLLYGIAEHRSPRDDHRAIHERGEAYLAAFPQTPYRLFLNRNFVVRWRPFVAMSASVHGTAPFIDGTTRAVFDQRSSIAPALGLGTVFGEHVALEFSFTQTNMALRRDLNVGGRAWPTGVETKLSSWALMMGWLERRGRQSLQLTGGLGAHSMRYTIMEKDHSTFSMFAGAAALEYQFDLLRSGLPYDGIVAQQWVLHLRARAGVEKAFVSKQGISPTMFLLQVGVGFDIRAFRRTDR
jgi:hypothetical protein